MSSAAILGSTLAPAGLRRRDGHRLGDAGWERSAAALAQAPAVWVVLGVALLLLSVRSRWAVAGWAVLAAFVTLGQVGAGSSSRAGSSASRRSTTCRKYPSEAFDWRPELLLTVLAAALVSLAWWRYRARDIG